MPLLTHPMGRNRFPLPLAKLRVQSAFLQKKHQQRKETRNFHRESKPEREGRFSGRRGCRRTPLLLGIIKSDRRSSSKVACIEDLTRRSGGARPSARVAGQVPQTGAGRGDSAAEHRTRSENILRRHASFGPRKMAIFSVVPTQGTRTGRGAAAPPPAPIGATAIPSGRRDPF